MKLKFFSFKNPKATFTLGGMARRADLGIARMSGESRKHILAITVYNPCIKAPSEQTA